MVSDANIPMVVIFSQELDQVAQRYLLPDIREVADISITSRTGEVLLDTAGEDAREGAYTLTLTDTHQQSIRITVSDSYFNAIRWEVLLVLLQSVGLALTVSVCTAMVFSWRRSRPIERLLQLIRSEHAHPKAGGKALRLEDTFVYMASEIQQFKNTIESLNDVVSTSLLERVFFTGVASAQTEESFLSYYGPMPQSSLLAVISSKEALNKEQFHDRLLSVFSQCGQKIYAALAHRGDLYILLENREELYETLEGVLLLYRQTHLEVIKAGISDPISGIHGVKDAVSQAERRLSAGYHLEDIYLFSHTYSSRVINNLLSVQTLDSLQRLLLTGNREAADKLIADVFRNAQRDQVNVVELRQLFFSLRTVYSLVISQLKLEAERTGAGWTEPITLPNDLDSYNAETVSTICLALNESISRHIQRLQSRTARIRGMDVMSYIESNFRDPDLCAGSIAAHFGLSEKYIFQLVKGACGETLNDRITSLRIQEAISLLESTCLSVSEIAERAGFVSSNTMYKVFVRVKGASPSSFRKKQK